VAEVAYVEDAIVVHIGRLVEGRRLALVGVVGVGGHVVVEATVVPLARGRCELTPR